MNQIDEWVSAEFQNLAEVLNDYDPYLALEWVPPSQWDNLIDKSKVFRVIDTRNNTIVLYADSLANPQQILGRVWGMDQNRHDVIDKMDLENVAAKTLMMKKHKDELDAQKDFIEWIAQNTKSSWVHEGHKRDEHFNDLGPIRKVIDK